MKKNLLLMSVLCCFTQPVLAANMDLTAAGLTQAEFKLFSEDLGSALSYKAVIPAEPLGVTGFDLALEVSSTELKSSSIWQQVSGDSLNSLPVPKLHLHKGLPFNIDVGAFYSSIPTTNIKLYGGELRYAILEGGVATPAVAIRGSISKLSGVDELSLSTKGLDISISKGFAMFTPYAGVGTVWVDSTPNGVPGLSKESFQQSKVFAGGNLNFGLANFALEYDKTGEAQSYSAKLGFRF